MHNNYKNNKDMNFANLIAVRTGLKEKYVENTIELLQE